MSREDLRAMFAELAEDVSQPRVVAAAVAQAARVRRRRRAVVGAAVAVLLVSGASLAVWRPTGGSPRPNAGPSAEPTTSAAVRIDRVPASVPADRQATPYWPPSLPPPANPPALAQAPISHAVLLYSPYVDDVKVVAPVYVYGEGSINGGSGNGSFHWARLTVDLSKTRDLDGNEANPLSQNALAPMGEKAAFAQPDAVLVVNLHTGASNRIPLPGFNEDVTWLPDARHVLVSSETKTWLVDTDSGSVVPAAARGGDVTPLVGGGTGLTTLALTDDKEPLVLRTYDDGGSTEDGGVRIKWDSAIAHPISYLNPRGWRYGNFVAQALNAIGDTSNLDYVVIIDTGSGDITRVLDLGAGHMKGCCAVLGWLNSDDVLVRTDDAGLLKWQLSTGIVTRLSDSVIGRISVAPTGCDWKITIAGVSSSCIH